MGKTDSIMGSKQKIIKWVDEKEASIIKFLQELISVPSDNPPGDCRDIAEFIERRLKEFGIENTQRLEVDPADAQVRGLSHAQNILSIHKFGSGKQPEIVLNAYGDTVPPGLGWDYDPYDGDIVDGAIYGRGAALAKSDISAYTFALLALKEAAEDELSGQIDLAFTFDGESGGFVGPQWLLKHQFIMPDMAITSGFSRSILNAHSGCYQCRVVLTGKSAHAASPDRGYDALEAMTAVLQALYDYRRTLKNKRSQVPGIQSPTLTIGRIGGGTSINVVPDQCEIMLDRRFIPEESGEAVEAEITRIVQQACHPFKGIQLKIERVLIADTFGPTPEETPLIQSLGKNWQKAFPGKKLKVGGIPLYSDARFYSAAGIPTVIFGAGPENIDKANGYQANEHIEIEDLLQSVKIIACTLFDLLKKP